MYNRAILIGRLCADPEMRTTPDGTNVTTVRVAVNRAHNRDKADFITGQTYVVDGGRALSMRGTD